MHYALHHTAHSSNSAYVSCRDTGLSLVPDRPQQVRDVNHAALCAMKSFSCVSVTHVSADILLQVANVAYACLPKQRLILSNRQHRLTSGSRSHGRKKCRTSQHPAVPLTPAAWTSPRLEQQQVCAVIQFQLKRPL